MEKQSGSLEHSSVENVQHTPSPWQFYEQRSGIEGEESTFGVTAPSPYHWVIPPLNINKHDAKLIAAAPDLLNMLQRMVDETSDTVSRPCLLTLEHARAAIAKAKGE